MEFRLPSKKR